MFITTAGRTNDEMIIMAKQTAIELEIKYVQRQKRSLLDLMESEQDDCIVVGKNRLELYPFREDDSFFFHPNSSMFRVRRLMKGDHDPFIDAAKLKPGMTLLDCTLGLASDSIVASYIVGPRGKVIGVEANPYMAFLVEKGLRYWRSDLEEMNEAMRRIQVIQNHSLEIMTQFADNSVDCVYFDPMFEERILESDGIRGLSRFANFDSLTIEMIHHSLRIARQRVILKDHYRSTRFLDFGFKVYKRKTSKFHFGVLEKN